MGGGSAVRLAGRSRSSSDCAPRANRWLIATGAVPEDRYVVSLLLVSRSIPMQGNGIVRRNPRQANDLFGCRRFDEMRMKAGLAC